MVAVPLYLGDPKTPATAYPRQKPLEWGFGALVRDGTEDTRMGRYKHLQRLIKDDPFGEIELPTDRVRIIQDGEQNRGRLVACGEKFILWKPDSDSPMGKSFGAEAILHSRYGEAFLDPGTPCIVRPKREWIDSYINNAGAKWSQVYKERLAEISRDDGHWIELVSKAHQSNHYTLVAAHQFENPHHGELTFYSRMAKGIRENEFELISGNPEALNDLKYLVAERFSEIRINAIKNEIDEEFHQGFFPA